MCGRHVVGGGAQNSGGNRAATAAPDKLVEYAVSGGAATEECSPYCGLLRLLQKTQAVFGLG